MEQEQAPDGITTLDATARDALRHEAEGKTISMTRLLAKAMADDAERRIFADALVAAVFEGTDQRA